MMEFTKKKRLGRRWMLRNPITFICVVVSVSCLLVLIITMLRLPDLSAFLSQRTPKFRKLYSSGRLEKFGMMMVEMLPDDLAFTVFVPSERVFKRDLRLEAKNNGSVAEERENIYAILSRVLGFSAVPRTIYSNSVPVGEEMSFDSISGYRLYIYKGVDGFMAVNGVRAELVDMKKGEIVVHIMDGVIMDKEFEQSVQPDEDEEDI
ncbi:hypothetical protein Nepgr_017230 [Nepenthes gracilis]|uniref:FAS1 domain-containing protein n=1 Tax=Nepenthes gracilis TaxID=150966 RepID=A0AAD3XSW8_NEPGR|nr:hypothetical protein Nepgr_017230 [Nepenthes gracilis]